MSREETRSSHRKFKDSIMPNLIGCESALAVFLKKDGVTVKRFNDKEDMTNEVLFSLATQKEFYTIFRLAALLVDNPEGDKLYEETVEKYKLKENV